MQHNRVPIFYDTTSSSNLPMLYMCYVLGRVPPNHALMPCFVKGNRTPTLPHNFGHCPGAMADSRNGAGNSSRLNELNTWTPGYCH